MIPSWPCALVSFRYNATQGEQHGVTEYIEARRAEAVLTRFRDVAESYLAAKPRDPRGLSDMGYWTDAPETQESQARRDELEHILAGAKAAADFVGAEARFVSYPPTRVGGTPLNVHWFDAVLDPDVGHLPVAPGRAMGWVKRAVGAAVEKRRSAFARLVSPWWWIIDWPAAILRLPFLILRVAGLSPKVEEHLAAQILKALFLAAILWVAAAKGLSITLSDLIGFLK